MNSVVENGKLTITLGDHIDAVNAKDVLNELNNCVNNADPHEEIVLDCDALEYISSAGFRILFTLREEQQKPITLINVSPMVYETFEVTGFTSLFEIHQLG